MTKTTGNFTDFVSFSRASGGTYLDSDGLIKTAATNVPRVEYDASGNRKGLLIEEARTNLLTYSVPTTTNWTTAQASLTNNATIAPDGSSSAAKLVEDATSNNHYGQSPSASIASGSVCGTAYLKAGERKYARLRLEGTTSGSRAWFDLDLGTVSYADPSGVATIQPIGGGWYRCSVTELTNVASATTAKVQVFAQSVTGSQTSYAGDGTSGIYVWGAQLEAGAFPTSYIPTTGATATRAADICSIATSAFGYNQGAGTIVVDVSDTQFGTSGYPRAVEIGNSSNQGERINIFVIAASGTYSFGFYTANVQQMGGILVTSISNPFSPSKAALAYRTNDGAAAYGGVIKNTDTSIDVTGTTYPRNTLKIGGAANYSADQINGHIKSIAYYPRRLTNAQIQALTA